MSPLEITLGQNTLLSEREQIELAMRRHAQRTPEERRRRREILAQTYGALNEEDGRIFEQAMLDARRLDPPEPVDW